MVRLVLQAELFSVKNVLINNQSINLDYLKGKNILMLDLKKISDILNNQFPDYRAVKIIRHLPNCIYVDFKNRQAIAYIKLYRYFAVDRDAVLFNPQTLTLNPELPVIIGLETKILAPRPKQRLNLKEVKMALALIFALSRLEELKEYRIKQIDASNAASFSFLLSGNLWIKIGEDLGSKLRVLALLLPQIRTDADRISYIDLRFKQPVIKYKNEK